MRIINVIEIINGIVSSVASFVMTSDETNPNNPKIKEANKHFISLIRENGYEGSDDDVEADLDNGQWGMNGYEALIIWSEIK